MVDKCDATDCDCQFVISAGQCHKERTKENFHLLTGRLWHCGQVVSYLPGSGGLLCAEN